MSKNRKKSETYRFNGNPGLHPASIESVDAKQLESMIRTFQAKLADPNDPDDKKWTKRWLDRLCKEHTKKIDALERKQHEKQKRHRSQSTTSSTED